MWHPSAKLIACLFAAFPALVPSVQVQNELSCNKTHLIHIGKTGGSTVNTYLWNLKEEDKPRLVLESHHFVLGSGDPGDCYAFFVRDPAERWVSGFLEDLKTFWRLQKQKVHKNPENAEKAEWFYKQFGTPNELAEALESADEGVRANALECNHWHFHCQHSFSAYLPNLEENLKRIVFVGEMRNLQHDFEALCRRIGITPPSFSKGYTSNVCPSPMEWMKKISPKAHANLRRLLKKDYEIMETLKTAGLIESTSLHRQGCVGPQERCMVMADNGEFRMVEGAQTSRSVDIYKLPNATKPDELPPGDDTDSDAMPEPTA